MSAGGSGRQRVYLDLTHVGRHVTGIERIAIDLFENVEFDNADLHPVRARGILAMLLKQQVLFPLLALLRPSALFVFPGFPPSPLMVLWRRRVVLYVHDLFLITRRHELGVKARAYMAWPFQFAVRRLRHFLVNSAKTRAELAPVVASNAAITLYRPPVGNVFKLSAGGRELRSGTPRPLKLLAIGTVEPRKNYLYAAAIRQALVAAGLEAAELHIIGRPGWGGDHDRLAGKPGVHLHGYLSLEAARRVIENADIYLATSHDEGLGLPLLEVQFAGLPVAAPDIPVFREVLGESGTFIPTDDAAAAARIIKDVVSTEGWRAVSATAALDNLHRWNIAAANDAARARAMFASGIAAGPDAGLTAIRTL